MKRLAELTIDELNQEHRPFRIVGYREQPNTCVIEYLDVYEYDYEWNPGKIASMINDGWGVLFAYGDNEGTLYQCLRRVKRDATGGDA